MIEEKQFTLSGEFGPKLTSWKREPTLQILKLDFEASRQSQNSWVADIQRWNDLMKVRGPAAPKKIKGRSSVQPKLIRRQNEWRYSALTEPFLGSNKLFKVSPVTWEDAQAAKQNELVLNYQFRTKLNRVKFIDDMVRADVDEGTAVLRVGWCRYTVPVKQKVAEYTHYAINAEDPQGGAQQLQQLQDAVKLKSDDPHSYNDQAPPNIQAAVTYYEQTQQPTYAVQSGWKEITVDKVVENHPTVEVMNPQNFFIDPSCNGVFEKALFAIISFETNKAALLKEPKRYKNLDQVNWEGSTPMTEPDHATSTPDNAQFRDTLRKRVVAYEWWGSYDITGTGVLEPIVCTWIGSTLIRMERNPFPDQKLPFVIIPYLPRKRELTGEPDAELLEDNQAVLGAVTRGMIDLLGRSANSQRGHAKGMLDPLNKRRYDNGEDYEFNPNTNPAVGIVEHKYPELPQSALMMVNLQNQDAESLTGVKSFSGGMSGESYGQVAAGIRGVLDAASKREMAILRRLAHGMSEVGQKIIAMNAVFLSDQEVIRITNADYVQLSPAQQGQAQAYGNQASTDADTGRPDEKNPDAYYLTVNREDLAGQFDMEVDISTAEVDNAKSQDLAFMLQTVGPNEDPDMRRMILAEICDLKRMPELAHKIRTYQPKMTPQQELEMQKMQLEVKLLESEIQLNTAKAQEAQASAGQKSAETDKTNLDYVEQETGTEHARKLDELRAQATGNQDLEVTKSLLAPREHANGTVSKPDVAAAIGFNAISDHKNSPVPAAQPVDLGGGMPALPLQGL